LKLFLGHHAGCQPVLVSEHEIEYEVLDNFNQWVLDIQAKGECAP
jgi:hypothetical protein